MLKRNALILSILFIVLWCAGTAMAEKYAFIIGIANYASQPKLHGPGNDVAIVKDLLNGWYGFNPKNMVVLNDKAASRSNIMREFAKLRSLTKNDLLAVYYSGHGTMTYTDGRIEEAIVPYHGDPDKIETLITTRELHDWLKQVPAGQADVILDCCYSGGFIKDPNTGNSLKCIFPKHIPENAVQMIDKTLVVTRPGHVVISAAQSGRNVPDTEFPLVDGTRLKVSALAFLMYRDLFAEPSISHRKLIASLGKSMAKWKIDQKPGVGGVAGDRLIFGGPVRWISAKSMPVIARKKNSVEIMGGTVLDLKNGAILHCFDSNRKIISSAKVSESGWRRSQVASHLSKSKIMSVRIKQ